MTVLDYLKLNVRHYGRQVFEAADDLFISAFAGQHYQRMGVPAWNHASAERVRDATSILSRLLALNNSAEQDAAAILAGKFRLFGQTILSDGGFPDWSKDYLSGHSYPVQPYGRYYIEVDTGADIISPWELSHLQFIPTLIGAHIRTPSAKYSEHFFRMVEHWTRANPFLFGVNWMCGLDVAIRAVNLALGIIHFGGPDDTRTSQAIHLLWAHLVYLQKRDLYLRKSVVNNHQLVAAVLHYALLHLFDSAQVAEWRRQAREIVAREVARQFHPDGGNFESALLYHQFVLESLYVAVGLLARDEAEDCFADDGLLPPVFRDRLWKASRFSADCSRAWSGVPQIGDSSDGRIFCHRDYFSWTPADCSHLADWGAIVFPAANPFANSGAPAAQLYADSGVGIFVTERYRAMFLAMPVSEGAAGHNHLDKASLTLQVGESPVFVDSGTFCYTSDLRARQYHRAGRAHNVLLVVGEDQASFGGPGTFETPQFDDVGMEMPGGESKEPVFLMWHDGYCRLPGVGKLTRRVHCLTNELKCHDTIAGSGRIRVELIFNLSPGLACEMHEDAVWVRENGVQLCTVRPPLGWTTATEAAWHSAFYGDRQPSTRLVFSATVDLPFEALTEILVA